MTLVCVIPARYASSRYPGKPLVELKGATGIRQSLVERTWRAAQSVTEFDRVIVATDDDRIAEAAQGFGADVAITSTDCQNGTERCAEVLTGLNDPSVEIVINLQGDAPLTPAWFLSELIHALRKAPDAQVATPVLKCDALMLEDLKEDRRQGRVGATTAVFGKSGHALYFSKEVIPFTQAIAIGQQTPVFHHVGVYAYRPDALTSYIDHVPGPLEQNEGLEQLRFLEQGLPVLCVEVEARGRQFWELNNPEDVDRIEAMMADMDMP